MKLTNLIIIAFLYFLASCTTSKKVSKSKASFDSTYLHSLEKRNAALIKENTTLMANAESIENNEVVFSKAVPCPEIAEVAITSNLNADSLKLIIAYYSKQLAAFKEINKANKNSIKKYADGSVEYTGAIARYRQNDATKINTIATLSKIIDSLSVLNENKKTRVINTTVNNVKNKKSNLVVILIFGIVAGMIIEFYFKPLFTIATILMAGHDLKKI